MEEPTLAEMLDRLTEACERIRRLAAETRATMTEIQRLNVDTRMRLEAWKRQVTSL